MTRTVGWLVAVVLVAVPAAAERCLEHVAEAVTRTEVDGAALLYRTADPHRFVPAPTLDTEIDVTVRGPLATTRVVQRFSNPSDEWVEGVYVFPLPTGSAVHDMRLVVGDRIIEGRVRERAEATRTYQRAKAAGRTASLVEQERPNLFTTSVANVAPRESVEVRVTYQEVLRWTHGRFELRLPTVVGVRYVPSGVADGDRLSPPRIADGSSRRNRLAVTVDLDAGFPLATLISPASPFAVERTDGTRYRIRLDAADAIADRDLVLHWSPARGSEPEAAVFTERIGAEVYALAMVLPPFDAAAADRRLPREVVLVMDTSGSMGGTSLEQARAAMLDALDRVRPDDFFNVMRFSSTASALFPQAVAAVPTHLERAREWVRRLRVDGGTEMLPALDLALRDELRATPIRQVVFVTDGCVGDEARLFAKIRADLGRSRLFTVGIGSAPNHHFMERTAAFGRGTFTFIRSAGEVRVRVGELMSGLETPVLTDVAVRWPDPSAEAWPERVPDLYAGEPILVAARLGTELGEVVVTGRTADAGWRYDLDLATGEAAAGVDRLWARRKVRALMDTLADGAPEEQVREQVVGVALRHRLLTRYTALVAVDVTPRRSASERLVERDVPAHLPAGWTLGGLPQGGTGWRVRLLAATVLALLAAWIWRRR